MYIINDIIGIYFDVNRLLNVWLPIIGALISFRTEEYILWLKGSFGEVGLHFLKWVFVTRFYDICWPNVCSPGKPKKYSGRIFFISTQICIAIFAASAMLIGENKT